MTEYAADKDADAVELYRNVEVRYEFINGDFRVINNQIVGSEVIYAAHDRFFMFNPSTLQTLRYLCRRLENQTFLTVALLTAPTRHYSKSAFCRLSAGSGGKLISLLKGIWQIPLFGQ